MNMMSQPGALITCPNCRQQFSARVPQIIDVSQDPSLKVAFLSGQHNIVQCPNCGYSLQVATPIAYHDPSKELLLVHVPMELNLGNDEQERVVGQFTRAITDALPMEQRKGYLLNPRRAFTLQGMVETVLEFDGVTKEMLNARRAKIDLMQKMAESNPEEQFALIKDNDGQIDEEFFQMLSLSIESLLVNGQEENAQQLALLRENLLHTTTYGAELFVRMQEQEQAVEAVTQDIQKLGQQATREHLLDLAISYAEDDMKVQVLVGLVRQAIDYQFMELLAARIEETTNKQKRETLRNLRERLLALTEEMDKQRRAQVQQAGAIIQALINAPDMAQAVDEALPAISDLVIAVLEANLQAAEQRQDQETYGRLAQLYNLIRERIEQSAPPEVQLINELLSTENQTEQRLMLLEHAPQFGETLLQYMDALIEDLQSRGADHIVDQLVALRQEAERAIG